VRLSLQSMPLYQPLYRFCTPEQVQELYASSKIQPFFPRAPPPRLQAAAAITLSFTLRQSKNQISRCS
jgi:hypothetical protein